MSLTDKYQNAVLHDIRKEEEKKAAHEFYKSMGFYDDGLLSPITLPEKATGYIKEAAQLIKEDKWHRAKMPFSESDAVYYWGKENGQEVVYTHLIDDLESYLGPDSLKYASSYANVKYAFKTGISSFIKLLWEDDTVRCGCLTPVRKYYDRGIFSAGGRAKSDTSRFVEEANRSRERYRPYLHGTQDYVIISHSYYFRGDGEYIGKLLLFRDGKLFLLYGDSVCFEDNSIFCKDRYGGHSFKHGMEDWLIRKVRSINGE